MPHAVAFSDVQAYLESKRASYLELLRRMVAINSFTSNYKGVNALADLTADVFAPLGFDATPVQSVDYLYGRHLVLTRPGQPGADGAAVPVVGLVSHLDTVYPAAEEDMNDFHWRVEGDRIYGPGTVDIKGGTVLICMVLDALRTFYPAVYDRVTWKLLLNAAEEMLVPDFGELARRELGAHALAALVFEGGDVTDGVHQLVVARKGMARYRIQVEGRSAHAGTTHARGANAIVQIADVIHEIAGFTDYDRDLTFNVGTIMGGTVMNRVPHLAAASGEMRAFDPDVFESGVERLLALNAYCTVRSAADDYPCRVRVELLGRWQPWPANEGTEHLLAVYREAGAALGVAVGSRSTGGLSDGNWLWDTVPTIDGLGPEGDNAHSSERSEDGSKEQEFVLASSFVPKALLNVAAIVRLVEGHLG